MNITVWHPRMPLEPSADEMDSLTQALSVWEALTDLGMAATPLEFDPANLPGSIDALVAHHPDVVFNLVEETEGLPSLNYLPAQILDTLRLAFTGNRAEAMMLTTHKVATKAMLANHGLPTPAWISGQRVQGEDQVGPYLIKPVAGDASQGICESDLLLHESSDAALSALHQLACTNGHGNDWFAERYIDGREFNLSLIEVEGEPVILPPAEMCFVDYPHDKPRIVGYSAKWDPDSFEYTHTRRRFDLPPEDGHLADTLRRLAADCWRLFQLRGYARVDFRVDSAGRPWILEVNTNPGIAPDAGLPAAAAEAGYDYRQLIARIAAAAEAGVPT